MIKQVIKNISEKYGEKTGDYFLFPTLEQLKKASTEDLMSCKTGFRAKYIMDGVKNVSEKTVDFKELENLPTFEVRQKSPTALCFSQWTEKKCSLQMCG